MTTPQDKAAEALRLAEYMRGMVHTYPQMSEDEPGGYCTEDDQCMDQASALLREYAALLQAQAKAEPLTDEAIHDEFHRRMSTDAEDMAMDVTDFRLGARFAERHHGILPKEN